MTKISIIREDDDFIADVRISLGSPRGFDAFYIVFRGEPQKVIDLLDKAASVAKEDLAAGKYDDRRGMKS